MALHFYWFLLLVAVSRSFAFAPQTPSVKINLDENLKDTAIVRKNILSRASFLQKSVPIPKSTSLAANFINKVDDSNPVEITFPTAEDAASMGIRDWPQKFYSSSWSESVADGQIVTRYVLDGKGRVDIQYLDPYSGETANRKERVYPGTLVEVEGEATLVWDVDNDKVGMIVLTPEFEEGGKLILVAGFLVALIAGLVAGTGG
mmetsp:Transcript_27972/g.55936  ORF Transcript_27972/g.55936 Transcript_27972/m.55936 type:complete len:204 (+) Transcript_27972:139-750(+)